MELTRYDAGARPRRINCSRHAIVVFVLFAANVAAQAVSEVGLAILHLRSRPEPKN
jgi:hypothetical protein